MKFVDEAVIDVQAGSGGRGAKSFRREKYVPFGGPDGGNGGHGGSVILVADSSKSTLLDFQFKPLWKAGSGLPGQGSNRDGKSAEDLIIRVPVGTQVFKAQDDSSCPQDKPLAPGAEFSPQIICDLAVAGSRHVIAKGGRGGKGNAFFKSATNQVPEHFQPGEAGESGRFLLSLKLVADVGLVGFPNAGKSTLISRISAARPKIADYPFTTLSPNLGSVRTKGGSFVVADIPGLIPGAHLGKGLGTTFLKHIERTRMIAHLIDPQQLDDNGELMGALKAYDSTMNELRQFSVELADKPQVVVLTKMDAVTDQDWPAKLTAEFKARGLSVAAISSVSGSGIPELLNLIEKRLTEIRASEGQTEGAFTPRV